MTAGAYTACRSDRMLPDVWPLHDVADVEALCRGVIAERTGDHGRRYGLESCDFDEALAFLLGEVVVLERVYDFTRAGIQFRPWLYVRLGWKLIDFWRSFYGRHGEKRVFDERVADAEHDVGADGWRVDPVDQVEDERDRFGDRLDQALAEGAVDSEEARTDAFLGFLAEPDRGVLREIGRVGVDAGEALAGRARAAADRQEVAA